MMNNRIINVRLATLVLLGVLPLIGGCGKNTGKKRDAMSKCVEEYAAANHGHVLPSHWATVQPFDGLRQWTIVIPVEELSSGRLDAFHRELATAVNAVDDTLGGMSQGSSGRVVYEIESGKFTWASGRALELETYSEGRGGAFRLITRSLEKDRNGLSGYYPVMKETPAPGGKWLVRLDLMVMK
jgi:hypothetical protein